ncbi:hypothetical protein BHM03_00001552 [Ensete ventricosum]|nr:hypothetical protein BHM03_00001552 [Ensete ventricosum]
MLPLQERVPLKNSLQRLSDVLVLSLLLSLLAYRLVSLHRHAHLWLIAFTCESWFTFVWLLHMNVKWTRVAYKTFPQRLSKMYDSTYHDLPAVDVFVTTADPTLEPPILTANTVLSLLAVEYPFHKLSCYVSDDAASPVTFYSLVESAKFAKLWVPFCKKHNVRTRVSAVMTNAPFMLNVDCDMFANNPEVVLHGMCLLLGVDDEVFSGFAQAPQQFYGALKDDPFGNQMVVLSKGLPANLSSRVEAAKKIGWVYGSIVEDLLTGMRIHSMGWRSISLTPEPPAFLGCAPTGGPASLTQHKRWATGLLEILLSRRSPILAVMKEKLMFRQCLGYMFFLVWPPRSVVELCYALLPAYCILADSAFLPKLGFLVPMALFLSYNVYTLTEYLQYGLSIRAWWNNQRMQMIYAQTSWLLGFFSVLLKILGLSETIFEVSQKDQSKPTDLTGADDPGRFTFDSSLVFVPGTAVVLINLTALVVGSMRVLWQAEAGELGPGIGEFVCSAWVLLSFWPFVKGLVGRGRYGIPWSVIYKAAVPVFIFLQMCRN